MSDMPDIKVPELWAMTLQSLIALLEMQAQHAPIVAETGEQIGGFSSYRGYYEQLAIVPTESDHPYADKRPALATVADVLAEAKACVGKTFQGWKGGDYVMKEWTDVWFAPEGSALGWRPVGFREEDGKVILVLVGGL